MEKRFTALGMVALNSMRALQSHLEPEEAERYLMGDSPEEETADLEEHLLVCEACREQVSDTGDYLSAMRGAASELRGRADAPTDRNRQVSRRPRAIAVIAGSLLLGVLALWNYVPRFR